MRIVKTNPAVTWTNFCRDYTIAASLLLLLGLPLAVYLSAAVTQYLWLLFAVPLGVPAIGLLHAWGLIYALRVVSRRHPKWLVVKPEHEKSADEHLADALHSVWSSVGGYLGSAAVAYLAVAWFGPVVS